MGTPSKVYYFDGATWIEDADVESLTIYNTVSAPMKAVIRVVDPYNVRNDVYTQLMPVRIVERLSNQIIFQGLVDVAETRYEQDVGQLIEVTVIDASNELGYVPLEDKLGPAVPILFPQAYYHIQHMIRYGSYTEIGYDTLAGGTFTGSYWVKGNSSGVIALIGHSGTGMFTASRFSRRGSQTHAFTLHETLTEYTSQECLAGEETGVTARYTSTWRRIRDGEVSTSYPQLEYRSNYIGVNSLVLDELTEWTKFSGVSGVSGAVWMCKRLTDTQWEIDFFHRRKYCGMVAATGAQFNGGTDPCEPENDGLTIAYGESDPETGQWVHMFGDYQFRRENAREICNKVLIKWIDTNERSRESALSDPNEVTLRSSRTAIHTHYWNPSGITVFQIASYMLAQLATSEGIIRGSTSISGWPQFVKAGTRYFVRAGHLVYIKHSTVPLVNNRRMLLRSITYMEPECRSELEFIEQDKGLSDSEYKNITSDLKEQSRKAKRPLFQTLAMLLGINRTTPPAVTNLDSDSVFKGIRLTWDGSPQYDQAHYRIYRDTVAGFTPDRYGLTNLIATFRGNVYYDFDPNLVAGTDYYYAVNCVNLGFAESADSAIEGPVQISEELPAHADQHMTGGFDLVYFSQLERSNVDNTLHDAYESTPHLSAADKSTIYTHASRHHTGGLDKAYFSSLERSAVDATTHDNYTSTPHVSAAEKTTWNGKPDLGELSTDAYRGDRGKIAYDHSQVAGTPHVSAAEKVTWNGKPDLGELSTDAYRGDRGKTAYDHSQVTGTPHVSAGEKVTWNAALQPNGVSGTFVDNGGNTITVVDGQITSLS